MVWKCYLTIFKAKSPIHIGYRQIGILKTTQYYITGRVMWGAVTANLTKALFNKPDSKKYEIVGNFVKDNIKTTYFYPAIKKNEVKNPEKLSKLEVENYLVFLPKYTENGLKFGELSKEKFEQIFVSSFVSTSIDAMTKTTEEGSLHEFEFIKNKVKIEGNITNVYWIGYIFVKLGYSMAKDNNVNKVYDVEVLEENDGIKIVFKNNKEEYYTFLKKDVLSFLFVGGERNYGLGRLRLHSFQESNNKIFNIFNIEYQDKGLILKNSNENVILATSHVELNETKLDKLELVGEIEPLVGLEWSEKGAGQKISNVKICATPGSKLKSPKGFALAEYGILKIN